METPHHVASFSTTQCMSIKDARLNVVEYRASSIPSTRFRHHSVPTPGCVSSRVSDRTKPLFCLKRLAAFNFGSRSHSYLLPMEPKPAPGQNDIASSNN